MKKIEILIVLTLASVFSLLGCSGPDAKKIDSKIQFSVKVPDLLPTRIGNPNKELSASLTLNKTIPFFSLRESGDVTKLGELKTESRIEIVGATYETEVMDEAGKTTIRELEKFGKGYYLFKLQESPNLWDGWLEKSEVPNLKYPNEDSRFPMFPNMFFISPDNSWIAFVDYEEHINILDKAGKLKVNSPTLEIAKIKDAMTPLSAHVLGWSSDSKLVWFAFNVEMSSAGFCSIEAKTGETRYFGRPENFAAYEFFLDHDLGILFYSDYPFQFSADNELATKKSGKKFHLYQQTLGQGKPVIVATNVGIGFKLKILGNRAFEYYNSSSDGMVKQNY